MKRLDLDILLQEGEGTMLEYKESLSASFARELVALANTAGGKILLGVRDEAHDQRCPAPIFEDNGFFTAIFHPNPEVRAQADVRQESSTPQAPPKHPPRATDVNAHEIGTKSAPSRHQAEAQAEAHVTLTWVETALLKSCASGPKTGEALRVSAGYSARTDNFKAALTKLLTAGLVQMALPDKPRSPKQRYWITPLGRRILNKGQKEQ